MTFTNRVEIDMEEKVSFPENKSGITHSPSPDNVYIHQSKLKNQTNLT